MNGLDLWIALVVLAAVFLVGRQVGHAEGWRKHGERIERDRGEGAKHLLSFLGLSWPVTRSTQYGREDPSAANDAMHRPVAVLVQRSARPTRARAKRTQAS